MMSLEYNAWRLREYLCSVCGLPLRCPDCDTGAFLEDRRTPLSGFDNDDAIAKLAKGEQWLDDVKLLCDPDDEAAHLLPSFSYENLRDFGVHIDTHLSFLPPIQPLARSGIEEFQAEHMGGPCFYLDDHDGIRHEVNVDNWDFPTFDGRPYIPIHSACLNMAKRVIKDSSNRYLSNIRSLFISLRWRHAVSNIFGAARAEANYMLGPTCWYLNSELFWESGAYYPDESDKAQWPGPTQNGEFNLLYVS
ncbi:hypothetical protein F4821DRAFT_228897 [Hypoxylon rubiginosum]|uniref:Uncharacterized protein n=1 Tax=Hypoxylon rubiginosum TaxID=110542 RepID=A0ACC0DC66_9PEZI|nr:hypothetical protein F4821DRAFT_228897 [Hypoxylon rubiginosum]